MASLFPHFVFNSRAMLIWRMANAAEVWRHFKRNEVHMREAQLMRAIDSRHCTGARRDHPQNCSTIQQKRRPLHGFVDKWKCTTQDLGDLRMLKFVQPLVKDGIQRAVIYRSQIHTPSPRDHLILCLQVLGGPPCRRALACMIRNKWRVKDNIRVVRYKDSTFIVGFREVSDFLRCCDRACEMLCDTLVKVSKLC